MFEGELVAAATLVVSSLRVCRDGLRTVIRETAAARRNWYRIAKLRRAGRAMNLELGSGPVRGTVGWTTVDWSAGADLQLDLTGPPPFRNDEVSRIYCSHVLEHFSVQQLLVLLAECHRVLRPGGSMSVAVPNARIYLDGYQSPHNFDARRSSVRAGCHPTRAHRHRQLHGAHVW